MAKRIKKFLDGYLWNYHKVGNLYYDISPETEFPRVYGLPSTFECPRYLIDFEQAITLVNKKLDVSEYGVHFYMDDNDLVRFYLNFDEYLPKLKLFPCVLTLDFSMSSDMPTFVKKEAVFYSRQIGQLMQRAGLSVPITLQWEDESTFDFCFRDVPKNSVVSISTVGVANKHMDSSERKMFLKGFNEAMIQLTPREVMHYGALLPECNYGNTKFVVYPNSHFLIDQFQFNKETANG